MGMVIDNPESYFEGLNREERIKEVLSQFIRYDEKRLDFCVENIVELIDRNYCFDEVPEGKDKIK